MKNLFSFLLLSVWLIGSLSAQTDYRQWETGYIKPKPDKADMLKKGMAAHNQKYHTADPYKANVFDVTLGPNYGSYFVVMGPMTFTQMEGRPSSDEHDADWATNVAPYIESETDGGYWRQSQDIIYRAPNSDAFGKSRVRNFTILPGQQKKMEELIKKVAAVYKAKNYPASYYVYFRWGASTGPHMAAEINFDNWSYLDRPDTWEADFNSVHGEGAWQKYLDEAANYIDRSKTYDEFIVWNKELSSK